ncbi:MAG: PQQ-binding-like beta-propeller repeat protein [Planctomycetota bacterium]
MRVIKIVFVLCVLCARLSMISYAEDWTTLGRDTNRSRSTDEKLSAELTEVWKYSGQSEIVASPAVSDGFVIICARDGYVRALRELDGSTLWTFLTGGEIVGSPAIYKGRVYVPSNGKVYCLRLSDGTPIWNYTSGGTNLSSPTVLNNILFMGSGHPKQKVLALNLISRNLLWEKAVEQIVYSSPAIAGNKVIIGCDSGRYYAIDKDNCSEIWSYATNGQVLLSSPLVIGNSVYLLPGGIDTKFYRIDIDNTPGTDYQIEIVDPNQPVTPTGGSILGREMITSSPMKVGNLIAFVERFDYTLDTNGDGRSDEYAMNEYVTAINPDTRLVKWQKLLMGSRITVGLSTPQSYGLCSTPGAMNILSSGQALVVLSTLISKLMVIDPSNGYTLATYNLDSAGQSSVAIANSRIFVATKSGSLSAFQSGVNRAPQPPISGFFPANDVDILTGSTITPTIRWTAATDPDSGDSPSTLRYLIRVDDDNEILENYDVEIMTEPGAVSITLPAIPITANIKLSYAIRTIDSSMAYSRWSATQSFWAIIDTIPPAPPTNLRVTPSNGYADLFWIASTSSDVKGYLISYKQQGGSFSPLQFIGNVTNYHISGLTNGINYTFQVITEDEAGLSSAPIEISASCGYFVYLSGIPYETLSDALSIAQSGETITLGAITFVLQNALSLKEGVNIKGQSPHQTILDGSNVDTIIRLSGTAGGITGTISNLTIYNASTGVDARSYGVSLKNTVIKGCGIAIYGNETSNIDIINNTIVSNNFVGIYVAGNTGVRNNIVMNNQYGIYWRGGVANLSKLSFSYNNVYGNETGYFNCSAGTSDISDNVAFINKINNDYREQLNQPIVDMGEPADDWSNEPNPHGGRINIGAYGNTLYAATSGLLHIATTTLSDSEAGVSYNVKISTAGGSPPLTRTINSGVLPGGLSLGINTGHISGIVSPTALGIYRFSVQIIDTLSATDSANFSIIINPAGTSLRIIPNTLSNGQTGTQYYLTIPVAGGVAPYTWSVFGGALPPNLILNSTTGEISGTLPFSSAGQYSFTIKATDSNLASVTKPFIIKIINGRIVNSGSSAISKEGNKFLPCFIATAAYGSPLAKPVILLKQFRDEYLVYSGIGQTFLSIYYKYSPTVAEYMSRHSFAKITTRIILIPAIVYAWFMVSTGLIEKILVCCLLVLLVFVLHKRMRKLRVCLT